MQQIAITKLAKSMNKQNKWTIEYVDKAPDMRDMNKQILTTIMA